MWAEALEAGGWGWRELWRSDSEFRIYPRWNVNGRIRVEAHEAWEDGPAAVPRRRRELHGAHLHHGKLHAQVGEGDAGAVRVDIDQPKPPELAVHLHPLGEAGDVRIPLDAVPHPAQWLAEVEGLARGSRSPWGG